MPEFTEHVKLPMLTRQTTLAEYEAFWCMDNLERFRPEIRDRILKRRVEVAELLLFGGETWEWSQGRDLAAHGGLAIVNNGVIVRAWQDWKS
ncbi:hypothetical protein [Zavarzinella formosa]|uniref:hypothetical protein n=1 Tax=Zavarzinella formosa TaxID=360055 RepID=UPI0003724221|nr:hypothetical protein [Zavarzinella formosa]